MRGPKVLLTEVISNFIPVRNGFYSPHTGLLSIAAYIEQSGFEVEVLDPWVSKMNWKQMLQYIKNKSPDVVGLTSLTCHVYHTMALAKFIKQMCPHIVIIAGGHHFSMTPEESLSVCDAIDYIVIGEGEETFLELLKCIAAGGHRDEVTQIKGIAFKLGNQFIRTPPRPCIEDLDILPYPAYHLLPSLKDVRIPLARGGTLGCTFSRGCDKKCNFCSESLLWRGKRRGVSVDRIIKQLELLVHRHKKYEFSINDTDFLYDRDRNIKFVDALSSRRLPIKFRIATRVDSIIQNRDILKEMRLLGLVAVAVGIESFSQKVLDRWNKQINVGQIRVMADCIREAKIPVLEGLMMIGSYDDQRGTVRQIVKESSRAGVNILWCSILTPFPKTPLYERAIQNRAIKVWDYRRYDLYHAIMPTKYISIKGLELLNIITYVLWFYNPVRFFKDLGEEYRRKFKLFQFCFDFRIFVNLIITAINKLFGRRRNTYTTFIEMFFQKHLTSLNKNIQMPNTIKVWSPWYR